MKWFKETFLPSFETGKEIRISEKQFDIFLKYAKNAKEENNGFLEIITYIIDDKKIRVEKHRCKYNAIYRVEITERI